MDRINRNQTWLLGTMTRQYYIRKKYLKRNLNIKLDIESHHTDNVWFQNEYDLRLDLFLQFSLAYLWTFDLRRPLSREGHKALC